MAIGTYRTCARCGEQGWDEYGKVCTKSHFICSTCKPSHPDSDCPVPNCPGKVP